MMNALLLCWRGAFSLRNKKPAIFQTGFVISVKPVNRFELLTCALRVRCSTSEPHRQRFISRRIIVSADSFSGKHGHNSRAKNHMQ